MRISAASVLLLVMVVVAGAVAVAGVAAVVVVVVVGCGNGGGGGGNDGNDGDGSSSYNEHGTPPATWLSCPPRAVSATAASFDPTAISCRRCRRPPPIRRQTKRDRQVGDACGDTAEHGSEDSSKTRDIPLVGETRRSMVPRTRQRPAIS